MQQYIDLTIDFANRNDRINGITLDRVTTRSYDTAIKFRIEVIGHALDETYDVKILSKYHKSGLSVMTTLGESLEIVEGKTIYTPKVNLITEADYIRNYLYLSKEGLGLDMAQFNYQVDVSQIGEITLDIRQAYDESYEALLAEFEQALEDYKLTLPQADSVRAEIDVILNQFGVDSQAKLNQYDADAQQAIEDNQTAFGLAETGRQDTYEQAEDNRNQASHQAVVDWEQGADAIINVVEANESVRVDAEATRKTNETTRVGAEASREVSEDSRQANESSRISDEDVRKANEIQRNDKQIRMKDLIINGDFSQDITSWAKSAGVLSLASAGNELTITTDTVGTIGAFQSITSNGTNYISAEFYSSDGFQRITLGNTSHQVSVPPNTWFRYSLIDTTSGNQRFYGMTNGALIYKMRKPTLFNLTQIFGAGNEPTKEQMDELIAITGYISGERVVSHQEMFKLIGARAKKKQEDWITPTLLNGTTTDPNHPAGYMKDEMGFVHFKGRVKATGGSVSLTVASGYNFSLQQGAAKRFSALTSITRTIADVQINYVGNIYITATSSDVWVHLDGIYYKAGD